MVNILIPPIDGDDFLGDGFHCWIVLPTWITGRFWWVFLQVFLQGASGDAKHSQRSQPSAGSRGRGVEEVHATVLLRDPDHRAESSASQAAGRNFHCLVQDKPLFLTEMLGEYIYI